MSERPARVPPERPLTRAAWAALVGLAVGLARPEWAAPAAVIAPAAVAGALLLRRSRAPAVILALLAAGAAATWRAGSADAAWWRQPLLAVVGREVEVEGIVRGPARDWSRGERFDLNLTAVAGSPEALRGGVRVRVVGPAFVEPGDHVRFRAILERPRTAGNPGAYSEQRALRAEGIALTTRLDGPPERVRRAGRWNGSRLIESVRRRLVDGLTATMPGPAPRLQAQVLASLAFGRYAAPLPEPIETAFRRSGLVHLLVASGTQVSLLLALVYLIGRAWPRWLLFWLGLLLVGAYSSITGWEPSILRAAIMGFVVLGALVTGRDYDALTSLALAAAVLLAIQPFLLHDVGFQLSFAATAGLAGLGVPLYGRIEARVGRPTAAALAFTLGAQLAVAPVLLWHFRALSVIGLVANLPAIPLSGLLVVLGLTASVLSVIQPPAAVVLNKVSALIVTNGLAAVGSLARMPGAYRDPWVLPPAVLVGAGALLVVAAMTLPRPAWLAWWTPTRRWTGLAVLAAALATATVSRPSGELEVIVLDVGQGDSLLVRTPDGRAWLIDAGPRLERDGLVVDAGADQVVPALALLGVRRLDGLIVTHADSDHLGGVPAVLAAFGCRRLLVAALPEADAGAARLLQAAREHGLPPARLARGDELELGGGARCYVLWPPPALPPSLAPGSNNASLVLKVVYGSTSFLLAADLETAGEERLLRHRGELAATVLKVGHQGSDDATSTAWLAAVRPVMAAISVGTNNYGHPGAATLGRLAAGGIALHRTDRDGMITYRSDGRRVTVRTYGRR